LSALGSTDSDNDPLSYLWQQRSGWLVKLKDVHADEPDFVPVMPGFYEFVVTVTDGRGGSDLSIARIFVGDVDPSRYPRADRSQKVSAVRLLSWI
jgi:hypothetical protein